MDFTLGYEVRSVAAEHESKPAIIDESQMVAFDIVEQQLMRLPCSGVRVRAAYK